MNRFEKKSRNRIFNLNMPYRWKKSNLKDMLKTTTESWIIW